MQRTLDVIQMNTDQLNLLAALIIIGIMIGVATILMTRGALL